MKYVVFATANDANNNARGIVVVTAVAASTDTVDNYGDGDNSNDAIVASTADMESDSNAVVTVVSAWNINSVVICKV